MTDIKSPAGESLDERLGNILLYSNKKNGSKSKNKSSTRLHSSPSSDSKSLNRRVDKIKSRKSSQEKKGKKMKFIPFNSATLRDCGEKFILNDNPGVGMYNHAESPYYGIIIFLLSIVKKEFNSNITKNFERQKMRKIWTDRYICRGYKYVNFDW